MHGHGIGKAPRMACPRDTVRCERCIELCEILHAHVQRRIRDRVVTLWSWEHMPLATVALGTFDQVVLLRSKRLVIRDPQVSARPGDINLQSRLTQLAAFDLYLEQRSIFQCA